MSSSASQENLITPDSLPLEIDFDTLDSASNYMHTYALSQGFDIRIQWSANQQSRICWSCYRGGFPESSGGTNPDGSPVKPSKRQVPKEKERRKRGSLKIGCPFRVQCTKNWKTGKMELRIMEGRHNHPMESDRDNLPSQIRKIKEQRKAEEEHQQTTHVNGTVPAAASAHASHFLNSAPSTSSLSMLSATVPNPVADKSLDTDADVSSSGSRPTPVVSTPGIKPTFERSLLNLLGIWDRSDAAGKVMIEKDLESTIQRAEAKMEKTQRKKRKVSHGSSAPAVSTASTPSMPLSAVAPNHARGQVAGLPRINGQTNAHHQQQLAQQQHQQQQQAVAAAAAAAQQQQQQQGAAQVNAAAMQQNAAAVSAVGADPNGTPAGKGSARCSNCKQFGHNRRRCPLG